MPRKTKDLAAVLRRKLKLDPELSAAVDHERINAHLASEISTLRAAAGLTQQELAERAGTRQPVIARLENAEYEGHSLKLLRRIAAALDRRIQVTFVEPTSAKRLPRSRTRLRKTGS
jgi:transcriptional regulator with XRE-family HTH domain